MPYSRQFVRPLQRLSPVENPHEFVEHQRLVGICDVCAWYEVDHFSVEAMVALLREGL